jgi:pyruvate dehydrogenase E2 component (dihydrolipoamide acetyltransferase)
MADVAMPRLSDSMEEGTILKWLKSDGDEVSKGEELVEIETDKANMTYDADEAGTLSIVAQEGDTLAVGETICRIGEGAGDGRSGEAEEEAPEAPGAEEERAEEDEGADEEEAEEEAAAEERTDEEKQPAAQKGEDEADAEEEPAAEREEEAPAAEQEAAAGDDDEAGADEEDGGEGAGRGDDSNDGGAATEKAAVRASSGGGDGRVKASPVARRMAQELGVELAALEGTGPGGRIVKADVEAAAGDGGGAAQQEKQPEAAPAAEQEKAPAKGDAATGRGETRTEELTRLQQTVARRMAESKATAPEFVMTCEVDMEAAVAFRGELRAAAGEQPTPSFNDLVVKAAALALRDFPRANGAYRDGKFELYGRVNVGIAVAGQDALVVPTVFDADRKSLGELARESRRLAERVRDGKITPPELASGTFTVSNLGMYGIARFTAVINPPQAAILAVGEMTPRPVVRDGAVVVRPIMELTLSCDHRILYGADAAQFLGRIRERLENPMSLVL